MPDKHLSECFSSVYGSADKLLVDSYMVLVN